MSHHANEKKILTIFRTVGHQFERAKHSNHFFYHVTIGKAMQCQTIITVSPAIFLVLPHFFND